MISKFHISAILLHVLSILLLATGCSQNLVDSLNRKNIKSFSFEQNQNNPGLVFSIESEIRGNSISTMVPLSTDVTALSATFEIEGYALFANDIPQESGNSILDYSAPINLYVFSLDGTKKEFTVTVTQSNIGFDYFGFTRQNNPGLPYDIECEITGNSIWFYLPHLYSLKALIAEFEATQGEVTLNGDRVQSANHYITLDDPAIYRITDEESTFFDFQLSALRLKELTFPASQNGFDKDYQAYLTDDTITVQLPSEADLSELAVSVDYLGQYMTINGTSYASGTHTIDFTSPVSIDIGVNGGILHSYTVVVEAVNNPSNNVNDPFLANGLGNESTYNENDLPVIISSTSRLNEINNDLTDTYRLTVDLDLGGAEFTPIGSSSNPFTGTFDGQNHTITNFVLNNSGGDVGFFSHISNNGVVENLNLTNVTARVGQKSGILAGVVSNGTVNNCNVQGRLEIQGTANSCGGLIGVKSGSQSILNSSFTGEITESNAGAYRGGIVGELRNSNTIRGCHVITTGNGITGTGSTDIGGIVGHAAAGVTISSCYVDATSASISGSGFVGGLIGNSTNTAVTSIDNSYVRGSVVIATINGGGLIGQHANAVASTCTIYNSYASVTLPGGGEPVLNDPNASRVLSNVFYDSTLSAGTIGIAKTTAELKDESVFPASSSWDFTNTWSIDSTDTINNGYPYLSNYVP
jgi:hypothetical protein